MNVLRTAGIIFQRKLPLVAVSLSLFLCFRVSTSSSSFGFLPLVSISIYLSLSRSERDAFSVELPDSIISFSSSLSHQRA